MKGPRKFHIIIPNVSEGKHLQFTEKEKDSSALLKTWKEKGPGVICFVNNPPQWSDGWIKRS